MVLITVGELGTFNSPSAEGQFVEALFYLNKLEQTPLRNPNNISNISINIDFDTKIFSGTYTFSVIDTDDEFTGGTTINAPEYLTGIEFQPGIDGTFTNTTLTGYIIQITQYLQRKEKDTTVSNKTSANNLTSNWNVDAGTYTCTFNMPIDYAQGADGSWKVFAQDYLL